MEADSRLSAALRSELSALKEKLCGTGDSLPTTVEKEALLSAINSGVCSTIAQKTELVQVACERADADGTGNKIHAENVLKHLSGDLLKDMDAENVAVAREKLNSKEKRDALVSQLGDRADPPGFIEAHKLRAMLTAVNMVGEIAFAFSPEVVGSTMRFLGVENESDDSVRISEMLRSVLLAHTHISHAGPHARNAVSNQRRQVDTRSSLRLFMGCGADCFARCWTRASLQPSTKRSSTSTGHSRRPSTIYPNMKRQSSARSSWRALLICRWSASCGMMRCRT